MDLPQMFRLVKDGKVTAVHRALPNRRFVVLAVAVASGATEGTAWFEAVDDLVVDYITARSNDADGLPGFRLGWVRENGNDEDFLAPNDATTKSYPVADQVVGDWASTVAREAPPLNLVFEKGRKRKFVVQQVSATVPFTVELTFHIRQLVPAEGRAE